MFADRDTFCLLSLRRFNDFVVAHHDSICWIDICGTVTVTLRGEVLEYYCSAACDRMPQLPGNPAQPNISLMSTTGTPSIT